MKCTVLKIKPSNFEAMVKKAHDIFSNSGDQEVTLLFSGGQYALTQSVDWDANTFPDKSYLRMIGGSRNKTILSSLKQLPQAGFLPVDGKPYFEFQFEKDNNGEYPNLRTLYVNGKIAEVARASEHRTPQPFEHNGKKYWQVQRDFNATHMLFVPKAAVDEVGVENCIGAEFHIRVKWEYKVFHIAKVDLDDSWNDENGQSYVAMYFNPNEENVGNLDITMCNRAFFISNAAPCLSKPGQYVYVRANGKLLYYPEGDISSYSLSIGIATNLFTLKNFESIAIQNITFTGIEDEIMTVTGYYAPGQSGRWRDLKCLPAKNEWFQHIGAMKVQNVRRMDLENCTFAELPCDALSLNGVLQHVTIRDSRFLHIGGSAIRIGHPRDWAEDNCITDLQVVNNYLDHIGFNYENSSSILITKARNAKINHNTVLRSSYSGLSIGWLWSVAEWEYGQQVNLENVEVAYNYVQAFLMNMRDGGGIYTLGGNATIKHTALMNRLHDNYIVEDELTCPENGFFASLYHDGASSHWYTYNNVIIHNRNRNGSTGARNARIFLQGHSRLVGQASTWNQSTWHILCENNFACHCKNLGEVYRSQVVDPEKASDMLDYSRHLRENNTHLFQTLRELKSCSTAAHVMKVAGCDRSIHK